MTVDDLTDDLPCRALVELVVDSLEGALAPDAEAHLAGSRAERRGHVWAGVTETP